MCLNIDHVKRSLNESFAATSGGMPEPEQVFSIYKTELKSLDLSPHSTVLIVCFGYHPVRLEPAFRLEAAHAR